VVALNLLVQESSFDESFSFNVLWPSPTAYPSSVPPNVALRINYTGHGYGDYAYLITYNTTQGMQTASTGDAYVSPLSPFTAYAWIPVPANSIVVVQAVVYRGTPTPQNLVFRKTLSL
jgi:hypothetical protein